MGNWETAEIERRIGHIVATVRGAGGKVTHQRLEIFREVASTIEHPDADTVFRAVQRRMPTVSLDTVYRTLWTLHDLGLVTTLGPQRNGVRFDANLDPHHHYICVRCGLVRDFESEELNDLHVPKAVRHLGSIVNSHVEVRGLCARCQRKQDKSTKSPPRPKTKRKGKP